MTAPGFTAAAWRTCALWDRPDHRAAPFDGAGRGDVVLVVLPEGDWALVVAQAPRRGT